MASFSFRTCKKVEESSEGGGEGGREGEQHNGARTPYIGLPDGRTAAGRGGRTTETETGVEDDWRLQGRHDVRKMGRLEQRLIKARQNPPTLPTSHLILETGTMIFVFTLMFSAVGRHENRQFGMSEFR